MPTPPDPQHKSSTPPGDSEAAPARRRSPALLIGVVLATIALFALGRWLPLQAWLDTSRSYLADLGPLAPLLFGVGYVVAALLFVPGALITIAGGTFFGASLGTLTVSLASTTAAALAFLLARGALRPRVESWARSRPRFQALDGAIEKQGWRVVGLLRLSPAMPFSLGNYLFGLTSVRFLPYVLVSWIAMLPGTFLYVSIGAAGADAATGATDKGRIVLLVVGIVATVVVTVLLGRTAKRRLAELEGE